MALAKERTSTKASDPANSLPGKAGGSRYSDNRYSDISKWVWYGIVEFNVPLDTV